MGGDKKMLRYVLTIAGAVALMSTAAFAEMGDLGSTTKIIHRSGEPGMASKKVVIHRNDDGFGASKRVAFNGIGTGFGQWRRLSLRGMETGNVELATRKKFINGEGMPGSWI